MVLFSISLAILIYSSLLIVSLFKPAWKIAALVGWWLIAFSLIILTELVASLFSWMDQPWLILTIQIILLVLAYSVWRVKNRPRLGGVLFLDGFDESLSKWADAWVGRLENILLSAFAFFAYGYSFFLGWKVAPNTYDSVTTHVVRVVYWLQHGNLLPWNSPRYTQVSYPVNAQLQMLWSAQFLHSDKLFFVVQFLGAIVTVLSVIGIARLLKFSRAQSLFAGLFFACIPLVWMQSSTTQNDLIAAGVLLPAIYFFFLGIEHRQKSMLVLSGLALGVAMGTKQTLFFYLPGFGLLVLLIWLKYRASISRLIITFAAASLASFAVLSSYMYIQNYIFFGHPLAPETALEGAVGGTSLQDAAGNISFNTIRLLYQSIDNSGLPEPINSHFSNFKDRTLGNLLRGINPQFESDQYCAPGHEFSFSERNFLSEDSAWFGPIAGVLLPVVGVFHFFRRRKAKNLWSTGIFIIVSTFFILDAWLRPGWDPFQGRYFIPATALMSILMGDLIRGNKLNQIFTLLIGLFCAVILSYVAVVNPGKWVISEKPGLHLVNENISALFDTSWVDGVTLQNQSARSYAVMVKTHVSSHATMGWYAGSFIEYPLFGPSLSRKLIPVFPHQRITDRQWLDDQELDYLLIDMNTLTDPVPEGFHEIDSVYNWILLERN